LDVTREVRGLLTGAAKAVDRYLPGLIDGSPPHSRQAREIADQAAAALMGLRSAGDLPGGRADSDEVRRVRNTIRGWSSGSLADLPRAEAKEIDLPTAPGRWSGATRTLRTILLGFTPLVLLVAVSLSPVTIPQTVADALAPFSVTWLLFCIASVFYPGDHPPDIKSLF